MASLSTWLRIISEVLKLISEGLSKGEAVSATALKFGVSEDDIWKYGGF